LKKHIVLFYYKDTIYLNVDLEGLFGLYIFFFAEIYALMKANYWYVVQVSDTTMVNKE